MFEVFKEITSSVNSSTKVIDTTVFTLTFRGIQSIPGKISKPRRDEIFNRVLRLLTVQQLTPCDTTIVDCINLLTTFVRHISRPSILLNVSLDDADVSSHDGNITDKVPLITLANILDFNQGIKVDLAATRALKLLAEATVK